MLLLESKSEFSVRVLSTRLGYLFPQSIPTTQVYSDPAWVFVHILSSINSGSHITDHGVPIRSSKGRIRTKLKWDLVLAIGAREVDVNGEAFGVDL
jgi:hypothetical protein